MADNVTDLAMHPEGESGRLEMVALPSKALAPKPNVRWAVADSRPGTSLSTATSITAHHPSSSDLFASASGGLARKPSAATFSTFNSTADLIPSDRDLEAGHTRLTPVSQCRPANILSSKQSMDRIAADPVPPKNFNRVVRYLFWTFFSTYRKLFTLVFALNLTALVVLLSHERLRREHLTVNNMATAASANLLVGVLMRNEHVVNAMFLIACQLPQTAPLWLRCLAAKVYSYGGFHSGCGTSAVVWYLTYVGLVTRNFNKQEGHSIYTLVITYVQLALLLLILFFAHPTMRSRLHDYFEATHRFAGWTAIALFWAQLFINCIYDTRARTLGLGRVIISTPSFWFLIAITALLIYPWLRLRSVKFHAEHLSGHAVRLHFEHMRIGLTMGYRLSDAPLKEWHGFATIPELEGANGFSILVSKAGDWTSKIISNPPEKLYVRGAPTIGVLRCALLFKSVVVVATGSGIGPVISLLQGRPSFPVRILWSTPDPEKTYGPKIMDAVYRADPDALIVDSRKTGRPDIVGLTYSLYREAVNAEAVFCIANPRVTRKVVYGMETRGIPAFGPIFDS
ncbi:hypothetical protein LTR50_001646 [Elasticomyces elasticus]|nr:hypothetical protein LTR50_001646 [Elasticomyces elasticus]